MDPFAQDHDGGRPVPRNHARRDGTEVPDLAQLAGWLAGAPSRRAWLHGLTDGVGRAVCRAFAEVAANGEVYASTSRLDLRVHQIASHLNGAAVPMGEVRAVREMLQRADALRVEDGGIGVRADVLDAVVAD